MKQQLSFALLAAAIIAGYAVGHWRSSATRPTVRQPVYYVDSMHPAYRSNKPGKAPDCGMELTPVYAEDLATSSALPGGGDSAVLHIDPAVQKLYGIRVVEARPASGQDTVRLFGRVAAEETRMYRINLGTDGYVKETHDDAVGERVRKDQRLAIVYSPDFLTAVGGYLSANERTPAAGAASMRDNIASTQNAASAQARADRLRNLGMSDSQIVELSTTRKIPEDVYVVSPADGLILERNISPGLRFERHTDLYTIGDLGRIWILAQITGAQAEEFRPGTIARITLPDTGEIFKGRVSSVLPEVDPIGHTLTIRLEADNPGYKLRPNMFVNVELPVSHSASVTVPSDAVLDTGLSKRVFVQTGDGYFAGRDVETGWRIGDRVQIIYGLTEGETVAAAGTFLIDSESRLQPVHSSGNSGPALPGQRVSNAIIPVERRQ